MNQYIITEEQIASIEEHGWIDAFHTLDQVRSHPYNPQDGKKNYFGGECTCNKFVNCHDCRDAFSYNPQAERKIIYRNVFRYPSRFPTIKARQLAYKDFEDGGESWCSLPESPVLKDGDIIQILREGKDGE